ncbi:cytochrome p450 704c1, partial [Quercus suber]
LVEWQASLRNRNRVIIEGTTPLDFTKYGDKTVKIDTICSRLEELSAGTSAGQQSNGGASQQSKETAGNYTDASASTIALSLADKDSHNNKQLWSKRAAEASDTEHQWDTVKIDTICSRLEELSAGTSAGQQSNGGASQQSKETAGNYTDASASTIALSLADKDSHNNKQLWSKRAAEASDTEHQWDVLETIETIPFHEVFIHSFGDYDTPTVSSGDGVPSLMTGVAGVASSFGVPAGTGLAATISHPSTSNPYLETMAEPVSETQTARALLLRGGVKIDTICSRLEELSAGTSAGQQSNGGASQQSKETAGNYTDASASTIALSLADKDSHNNKQLWSKRAAEASDTEHQWDVLETIETIPFHEVFIHSFGDYDTRGLKLQQKHGKKYHPLGGTIFNQLLNFNRLQHYLTDLAGKYKTYWLLSPFRNEIYTTDPANVECIHETNFNNYGKVMEFSQLMAISGANRGRYQVMSSPQRFKELQQHNLPKECGKTCSYIDLFMKSTLDSIFKVAFGVELDSMCASSEECKNFGKAFDDSSALIFWRYVDIFWQMKRFLNIGSEAALKKNIEVVDSFVYKLIHIKVQRMHDSENDSAMKKEDILSRFLQVSETSTKYLRDIILNFISVGKDTTATTLSWLIYMLCRHPSLQDKVAQEVKEATKMSEIDNFAEFAASMNEETLGKMQYLHAAITETIRLYPPLPVVRKKLTICISMMQRFAFLMLLCLMVFSLRKGDMVAYQLYAMGRMRFICGNDAGEFKPKRWLDEDGLFRQESPFKFTAFQIFSTVLLGCYVFKLSDDKKAIDYRTMLNLHIDRGLHVRVF